MSSREAILASIRSNLPKLDRPLPTVPKFADDPPANLVEAFGKTLTRMGGRLVTPDPAGDIRACIRGLLEHSSLDLFGGAGDRRRTRSCRDRRSPGAGGCRSRRGARFLRRRRNRIGPADGSGSQGECAGLSRTTPHRSAGSRGYRRQHPQRLCAAGVSGAALRRLPFGPFRDSRYRGRAYPGSARRALAIGSAGAQEFRQA